MKILSTTAPVLASRRPIRLPDPPERPPEELSTQYRQLFHDGLSSDLRRYLGTPETTLVTADDWVVLNEEFDKKVGRYPDLMVAFDVDPQLKADQNGYIISEQGKPPDFVLEVASESTGANDVGVKRGYYISLGVAEYWRFDQTEDGRHHGERMAADILVEGNYEAARIKSLPGGGLKGYSKALDLYLHWQDGQLMFYDPKTGRPIPSGEAERSRANAAEADREAEHAARVAAEADREAEHAARVVAEADREAEHAARVAAEARVRELEGLLRSQGPDPQSR